MDTITETEHILADRFGRKRAFLLGRGATGLVLLYRALTPEGGRVILPAIACPSLLAACLLAERRPVIVDVDRNLNIDPALVALIAQPGDLVVGIHMYGIPCAIDALQRACSRIGAMLIEDAAQAIGGRIEGRRVGGFGTASLLSFAEGKILPTQGGGAILTDDEGLVEKLEGEVACLPERPQDLTKRARALRDELTAALNAARRDGPEAAAKWLTLYDRFGDIYCYAIEPDEIELITSALDDLDRNARSRREKVGWYRELMDGLAIECLGHPDDSSPFRFTFIMPELSGSQVQDCTEALRAAGLHASNLYVPLHWLAPGRVETTGCPRADFAGPRIINLWVDDEVSKSGAQKAAEIVRNWAGISDGRGT